METTLDRLAQGQSARICQIQTEQALKQRLLEHGLIEGTYVRCLRKRGRGASAIYLIRGSMLALRGIDSARIRVVTEP